MTLNLKNSYNLNVRWLIFAVLGALMLAVTRAGANDTEDKIKVQKIKAAYLYNFLLLSDWPDKSNGITRQEIVIGIVGNKQTFSPGIFEPIIGKLIEGKKLQVRHHDMQTDKETLRQCSILYITSENREQYSKMLSAVEGHAVMTIGEAPGFTKDGGIAEFVQVGNNIRFKINKNAIDRSGIWVSSQVLRLAEIVEE